MEEENQNEYKQNQEIENKEKNRTAKIVKKVAGKIIKQVLGVITAVIVPLFMYILIGIIIAAIILAITDFVVNNAQKASAESSISSSSEIYYDYMRMWEKLDLYLYYSGQTKSCSSVSERGYYKVYYGGAGDPTYNLAYGLLISLDYDYEYFKQVLGCSTTAEVKAILDKYRTDGEEFTDLTGPQVEEVYELAAEGYRQDAINSIDADILSKLKQNEIDALAVVQYQYGNLGNFNEIYNEYGNNEEIREKFVTYRTNGGVWYPFSATGSKEAAIQSDGYSERADANWNLFHNGIYSRKDGDKEYVLDPADYGGSDGTITGTDLVSVAQQIHDYMSNPAHKYYYCLLGASAHEDVHRAAGITVCKLCNAFEASKTESRLTCCATYVSWCLQETGYIKSSEHVNSVSGIKSLLSNRGGWKKITINSSSDLKAGDVVTYTKSHVAIYAGQGYYFDAGSNESIQRTEDGGKIPQSWNGLPACAYRYVGK